MLQPSNTNEEASALAGTRVVPSNRAIMMKAYDALPQKVRNKLQNIAWNIDPLGVYVALKQGFNEEDIIESLQAQSDRQSARLLSRLQSARQTS